MTAQEMDPEDLEAAINDSLVNAEAWRGGHPGVVLHFSVFEVMRERGLLGKGLCLTYKGMEAAKAAQRAYWGD
jgi:hypothetical protein